MCNRFLFIGSLFILYSCSLYSQTPPYSHYTSSDGLASSTVFEIIQDKNGFIWTATLNGLSRFDGKRFTTFKTTEGLNSNSIISIAEGEGGEIYIANYEKGINVLNKGRIENFYKDISGTQFQISYLLISRNSKNEEELFAHKNWGNIEVINIADHSKYSINVAPLILNKIENLPGGRLMVLTNKGLYKIWGKSIIKIDVKGLPDTPLYCLESGSDGSYFIGTRGIIYKIKDNVVIKEYKITQNRESDVVGILEDRNNNLWFSVMNKGFYLIPKGFGEIIDVGSKMELQNTLVNNYLEDNEGNIWISTFGKGIYCLSNLFLSSYNENDGLSSNNVYSICGIGQGKLLFGTFNGVNILQNRNVEKINIESPYFLTDYIHKIRTFDGEIYICYSGGNAKGSDLNYNGSRIHMLNHPSFFKTMRGFYLSGTGVNSIFFQRSLSVGAKLFQYYLFDDVYQINRVNDIFEDSNNNVWLGTNMGLCKLSDISEKSGRISATKTFFKQDQVLSSRINLIYQDKENHIWFVGEKGISTYDLSNDSLKSYMNINQNDLSSSTSIVSDNKGRTWIGNMKGLLLLDEAKTINLNMLNGLPSNEILSLYYEDQKNLLYIGTSNGFSILDLELFDSYNPQLPEVKIISLKAGDSVYTDYSNLIFKPDDNDIMIEFKALNYSSPGATKYKYKLNDKWVSTEYDYLNFSSLKYGTYNLEIMAKTQNFAWGKPISLTFRVLPKFIETFWFDIISIVIVVTVPLLLLKWRLNVNKLKTDKDLELSKRINQLKHQALSSMMNPHFIFNSLNSVQYLINFHKYEEANDYIAMMAKLIRKNLDSAGSGFILLSEEIERLQLYLDLEKLRFQEGFSYEIIIGSDVDIKCIKIPNMIIQPFVENSLWHGIINSGNSGLLSISFTFNDVEIDSVVSRSLIIKVTDNGIGFKESRKNKKADHISKGIQIIEERLRLLSAKMELPQPIMFEDLSSRSDNSKGTEVIISLPTALYKIFPPEKFSPSSLTD